MEAALIFYQKLRTLVHSSMLRWLLGVGCFVGLIFIGLSYTQGSWGQKSLRFFTFQDRAVLLTVLACAMLGMNCGILGSYVVVRKIALIGDVLSHAILPGVALGFVWSMSKNPLHLFVGAVISGGLSVFLVHLLRKTTRIREDSILAIVLTAFYAVGICLLTWIQQLPTSNKAGLNTFLLGQASAIAMDDIMLLLVITVLTLSVVIFFYKSLLVISFDTLFAGAVRIPVSFLNFLFMLILAFSIVVSIQAVGVVLVAGLLVIPAATAYLLTQRFHIMLIVAGLLGVVSAYIGAYISYMAPRLPTGPFIIFVSGVLFTFAFMFNTRSGVLTQWFRLRRKRKRISCENDLKSIYKILERTSLDDMSFEGAILCQFWGVSGHDFKKRIHPLIQLKWVTWHDLEKKLSLTPKGFKRAQEIVRNHRLWELYLTNAMGYPLDHVHEDAERIEHVLDEETILMLEKRLNYPEKDPHGKTIPEPIK